MPVDVRVEAGPFPDAPRLRVRTWAERMLAALGLSASELSVVLTSDARIRRMNRDYRQKDRPTDVLAFAMREGAVGPPERGTAELLGDVMISVETARRQARGLRRPLDDELLMLLAHGLLHLVGYDHQTLREERRMTRLTATLCKAAERAREPSPAKKRPKQAR